VKEVRQMKHKRFSVEQIIAVLKQADLGLPVADPAGRDFGADILPLEAAICWVGVGSGSRAQAR
jgi:hypothetical protein